MREYNYDYNYKKGELKIINFAQFFTTPVTVKVNVKQ